MAPVTRLALTAGALWLVGFLFVPRGWFALYSVLPMLVILGVLVGLNAAAWLEARLRGDGRR